MFFLTFYKNTGTEKKSDLLFVGDERGMGGKERNHVVLGVLCFGYF